MTWEENGKIQFRNVAARNYFAVVSFTTELFPIILMNQQVSHEPIIPGSDF